MAVNEMSFWRSRGPKREINLNFYFHASLWCFKRFYESLKGHHKIFLGITKKCEQKKLKAHSQVRDSFWQLKAL